MAGTPNRKHIFLGPDPSDIKKEKEKSSRKRERPGKRLEKVFELNNRKIESTPPPPPPLSDNSDTDIESGQKIDSEVEEEEASQIFDRKNINSGGSVNATKKAAKLKFEKLGNNDGDNSDNSDDNVDDSQNQTTQSQDDEVSYPDKVGSKKRKLKKSEIVDYEFTKDELEIFTEFMKENSFMYDKSELGWSNLSKRNAAWSLLATKFTDCTPEQCKKLYESKRSSLGKLDRRKLSSGAPASKGYLTFNDNTLLKEWGFLKCHLARQKSISNISPCKSSPEKKPPSSSAKNLQSQPSTSSGVSRKVHHTDSDSSNISSESRASRVKKKMKPVNVISSTMNSQPPQQPEMNTMVTQMGQLINTTLTREANEAKSQQGWHHWLDSMFIGLTSRQILEIQLAVANLCHQKREEFLTPSQPPQQSLQQPQQSRRGLQATTLPAAAGQAQTYFAAPSSSGANGGSIYNQVSSPPAPSAVPVSQPFGAQNQHPPHLQYGQGQHTMPVPLSSPPPHQVSNQSMGTHHSTSYSQSMPHQMEQPQYSSSSTSSSVTSLTDLSHYKAN